MLLDEKEIEGVKLESKKTLIAKKTGKFDASDFHDCDIAAFKDRIERKKGSKKLNIDRDDSSVSYRGKRNFARTAEPSGANVKTTGIISLPKSTQQASFIMIFGLSSTACWSAGRLPAARARTRMTTG